LGNNLSDTRAGDIVFPQWQQSELSATLLPSGPSIEGIAFVSRAIMTGKSFLRNSKNAFLIYFGAKY